MILQTLGVLIQAAGVLVLFLHWRAKRGFGGGVLAAGWALLAIGAAPWFLSVSPERALAIGALAPMALGLLFAAADGAPRLGANSARKKQKPAPDADDSEPRQPGRRARTAGRWFAGLVAAPLFGFAAAAAWQAAFPGPVADRIVFSGFVLIAAWSAIALWLLAAARPWRSSAIACAGAIALVGGALALSSKGVV